MAAKYPWELWENGEEHTIEWGKDFDCGIPSIIALLHGRAKYKQYLDSVSTSNAGTQVIFQFTRVEA